MISQNIARVEKVNDVYLSHALINLNWDYHYHMYIVIMHCMARHNQLYKFLESV